MNVDDFSYIRCLNCKNVIIQPIPYKNNRTLLYDICCYYDELNECCNDAYNSFGSLKHGIKMGHVKITDLPLALRKEFPPEVTHEFACCKHSLVVTKHNGDKVTVSVNNNNVMITDTYATTIVYVMDD